MQMYRFPLPNCYNYDGRVLLATPGVLDRYLWVPVRNFLIRRCGVQGADILVEALYAVPPGGPQPPGGLAAAAAAAAERRFVIPPVPRYGPAPGSVPLPAARPDASTSGRPRSLLERRLFERRDIDAQAAQLAAAQMNLAIQEAQVPMSSLLSSA